MSAQFTTLTMRSTQDWSPVAKAQTLVELLTAEGDFWLPQKMDNREPERFDFDPSDLSKLFELWTSEIRWLYLKRRKPHPAWLILQRWPYEAQRFNEILGSFDERYLKEEEAIARLLAGAKRLYAWGRMVHGYLCHEADWNAKNYFGVPTQVAGGRLASSGGLQLEEGLPGIYWANFFGPLYVEFFGRQKFETVPAHHKETLPDGGFMLLTAPSPLDYGQPEVRAFEQEIIDHLGREAFFEKTQPRKACLAPQFTFEQAALGQALEIVAEDPVSRVIADPHGFIQEAPRLAAALSEHFKQNLDYSPESLSEVDSLILKHSYRRSEPWANEKSLRLVQELTAYYGEVLRRNLGAKWIVQQGSGAELHPAVEFPANGDDKQVEYPFVGIYRLWLERNRAADGLLARFFLLQSGQLKQAEDFLKGLGLGNGT